MLPLRSALPFVLCALFVLPDPSLVGQAGDATRTHPLPGTVVSLYEVADSAYYDGRPEEAWNALIAHLEVEPEDYEALWRAARSALVIAVDTEGNRPQNAWLDPGRELAARAILARPDGVEGLYFRAALTGRRAMNATPGYAVELAQITYDDAHRILAIDSLHGGAHNVLGKLNFEVMSLSRFERLIARLLMGNDAIRDTGWDQAEYHLERAVELWPELVLFRYDLAALHRKRGREDEARAEAEQALGLPVLHPPDPRFKEQAQALLDDLSR